MSSIRLLRSIPAAPELSWLARFCLAHLHRLARIAKHLRGKDRDKAIEKAREDPARTALLTIIIVSMMLITVTSLAILRFESCAPEATLIRKELAELKELLQERRLPSGVRR